MMLFQFIIFQIIIFGVIIFVMKKILSSDTQVAVTRMDAVYQDLLAKQKELNEKIEEAEEQYQAKKKEAEQIGQKVRAEATEEMRAKRDEFMKQSKAQADEILTRAREGADVQMKKIEIEARSKAVEICAELLVDALEGHLSYDFHKIVLEAFLKKSKDFDLTKISPQVDTVTIKSPYPLDEQEKSKIKSLIAAKINRSLKVEEIEDKNLIAGCLLQFGTLLLDGSVANGVREAAERYAAKIQFGQK